MDDSGPHKDTDETPTVRPRTEPDQPTPAERAAHETLHLPYRSWCRACVAGRGRSDQHNLIDQSTSTIATEASDYAYLAEEGHEDRATPILVSRNDKTKWLSAETLPCKGTSHPHNVTVLAKIYESCGFQKLLAKSDNEPALLDLKRKAIAEAALLHGKDIEPIESPVGESQSNGFVENAVRDLKGMARTLKFAAEELHNTSIGQQHPCLPWLIRHAAIAINIGQRAADGKTAYECLRGKPYRNQLPAFGERVHWLPAGKRKSTLDMKWQEGIYLGIVRRSDESLVGMTDGVVKARSIRRMTTDNRSDAQLFNSIRGTPWQPVPGKSSADVPTTTRIFLPAVVPMV